ncbi:MAG TPA: hypothetical protein VLR46_12010 [Candidatus Dormibacteraeota bacterium]|nr:hypothetical protein [Candidatus Dormibacteraeota bacterium]
MFWGLLALGLLLLFFVLPHTIEGDGRLRFDALQSWLAGGAIPDTKYPLIGSLPSVLLILLGRVIGSPDWWVARYDVIVYAAGVGLLYALLRRRLATDVLGTFLLLLGITAMLPSSLTGFGAEAFSAMAVGAGLVAWSGRRWKTAVVMLGLGVANLPASLVGLALAMGWWAWRNKQVKAVVPVAVAGGLWLLENLVRRKTPLATGYGGDHGFQTLLPYSGLPGFSYPTFFGILSLLFSFGKGILFFAPGLVLAFGRGLEALRSVREVLILWTLYLAGLLLVYGTWWAWYGGFTWGPRFLTFASLPASLLLAAQLRRPPRTLLVASVVLVALVLSVWVGIDGATFGRFAQSTCNANHYALESFCWYIPEFSVLTTPFVFHAHVSFGDVVFIAYALGVAGYVAYPLLRQWWLTARRDLNLAWAAYRKRPSWRF